MQVSKFSIAGLRRNYAVVPLVGILGAALVGVAGFTLRTAMRAPEAAYRKHQNPEPWNEYRDKEFRLYNPTNIPKDNCPAPAVE